ncbi:MAG TPA: ABC transporter permease [Erysipelothrix sp.]|nr:ABC transporter permease [Erysipelothrix sp.]
MTQKNPVKDLNIKQKLSSYYFKGLLSLVLLGVLLLNIIVVAVNRFRNVGLVKELSLATFDLDPNFEQSYRALSTAFTIEMILLVILWIVLIIYFVAWYLRRGKIRLDSLVVYTLIGVFLSSILYLTFSSSVNKRVITLSEHQECLLDVECEADEKESETYLMDLSESVNQNYFLKQTSVLAFAFFTVLSSLQLVIDRVRKIIVFYRLKKTTGGQHG